MIKKILKYIMTIMILGCIVGLVSYKCVNLYIERTYGSVKADALTKNDFFKENKELLSKNKEPIEYVYDNNFKVDEVNIEKVEKLDLNSYAYIKNEITTLNTDYEMASGIKDLLYQTINSYKGNSSVYIIDLASGMSIGYNVDNIYQTASVIKAAYCLYLYKQVS